VVVVAAGQVVARHRRGYGRGQQILDPLHYLAVLGRRPAALDHAGVYRNWRLPADFSDLRTRLEARHGPGAGARPSGSASSPQPPSSTGSRRPRRPTSWIASSANWTRPNS